MLTRFLPDFLKRFIANEVQRIAERSSKVDRLFIASHPGEMDYIIKPKQKSANDGGHLTFPVPPEELMVGYGPDVDYLKFGKLEVTKLIEIVSESGFSMTQVKRVLEFGCAAGRMIRHFPERTPGAELWGVDISARHIQWCVQNLAPAIHFASTTLVPHLPFEDCYFDLIFCGSVFTHIEDIHESWLLDLGRILRPLGKLYLTIHDENTVRLLDAKYTTHWFSKMIRANPLYARNKDNFATIVIGRGSASQVFYNSAYLRSICPPIFRWVSVTPEAYGYQSAVLLEKRERTQS